MWEKQSNGFTRTLARITNLIALGAVALVPAVARGDGAAFDPTETKVVFTGRKYEANHLFEIRFYPGGNLFMLDSLSPAARARNVTNLKAGDVQDVEVSYDGTKILFSMRRDASDTWHLWRINADGGGLEQLTFGPQDDVDPAYLPDGRIMFCSTRPGFLDEYHREPAAVLHVMNPDGTEVEQISFNVSHDVTPTVLSDGRILYPRWEHHGPFNRFPLFAINPDGTGLFQYYGARERPSFYEPQEMADGRLVAVLSPSANRFLAGPLAIIDGTNVSTSHTVITPEVKMERVYPDRTAAGNKYRSPYPLPDGRLLVSYAEDGEWDFGIYTLGLDGKNRQLVYNNPELMEFNPQPILPRKKQPVIPAHIDASKSTGTFFGMDVYLNSLTQVPRGEIKSLRVVEGLPRPSDGDTKVSINRIHEVKRILGEVPIQADGSFYFEAPANTPLHLQTIGQDGIMLTNQRTWVWLRPGENRGCVGCHEVRESKPAVKTTPMALRHPPTRIGLDPETIQAPITFVKDIQPILSRKCVKCHSYSDTDLDKLPAGGLDLAPDDSFAYNVAYANLRYAVVADSSPRTSYLVWKILGKKLASYARARARRPQKTELKGGIMPPPKSGITLSDAEKQTIIKWIEMGAVYRDYETQGYQAGSSSKASAAAMVFARRCGNAACHDGRKASPLDVNLNSYGMPIMRESVNYTHPENSLLLRAALSQRAGGLPHAGGDTFQDTSDADYQTLLAYIREAAKNKQKIRLGNNAGY